MLYQKHQETVDEKKSDETYCLRSLLHFGVINSTIFSFIYFNAIFSVQTFFNVQNSLGGHRKNSVTLQ